jgi:hypothetical protein
MGSSTFQINPRQPRVEINGCPTHLLNDQQPTKKGPSEHLERESLDGYGGKNLSLAAIHSDSNQSK